MPDEKNKDAEDSLVSRVNDPSVDRSFDVEKMLREREQRRKKTMKPDKNDDFPMSKEDLKRETESHNIDTETAFKIYSGFFGIPVHLGVKYCNLLSYLDYDLTYVKSGIISIIAPTNFFTPEIGHKSIDIGSRLSELDFMLHDLEDKASQLLTEPYKTYLFEKDADSREFREFLISHGYAKLDGINTIIDFAIDRIACVQHDIQHFEDGIALKFLNRFVEDIKRIYRSLPIELFKLFMQDYALLLCDEVKDLSNDMKQGKNPIESFNSLFALTDFVFNDFDIAMIIHELVMETLPYYERINNLRERKPAIRITELLREHESFRYTSPNNTVEALETLQQNKVSLKTVVELLGAIAPEEREELFSRLAKVPAICSIYKAIKGYGISPKTYSRFILDYSTISTTFTGKTAFEAFVELSQRKGVGSLLPFILEQGISWTQDKSLPDVISILTSTTSRDLWFREYLAIRDTSVEKADLILELAKNGVEYAAYKTIKDRLEAITEEDLAMLKQTGLKNLVRKLQTSDKPSAPIRASARQKLGWYDILHKSLTVDSQLKVESFYRALADQNLDYRLRYVWQQNPQNVISFIEDMELLPSEAREILLKNNELFGLYYDRLSRGHDNTSLLKEVAEETNGNAYFLLRTLLRGNQVIKIEQSADENNHADEDDPKYPVELVERKAEASSQYVEVFGPKRAYSRVLIYGGIFKPEARRKIQEASSIEVRIVDLLEKKKNIPPVTGNDLVIIATGYSSHTFSGRVLQLCNDAGIKPVYLSKKGYQSVIRLIEKLVA